MVYDSIRSMMTKQITKQHSNFHRAIVLLVSILALIGCTPNAPAIIRVTPTPNTSGEVLLPSDAVSIALDTSDGSFGAAGEAQQNEQIELSTATPTDDGDGRFIGPVIGRELTPVPTLTTPPTAIPSATLVPSMTPIPSTPTPFPETPVATPLGPIPTLDTSVMGIQLYYNVDIDFWWQLLQRTRPLGTEWIKVQADWSFLQPSPTLPDQSDVAFSLFRSHIQRAHNEGFKVLVSVAKAPAWARNSATEDGPPTNPQDLVTFVDFLLQNIGNEIDAIEIWNEPNLRREWNGGLDFSGAGYMQLFDPVYQTVRARYPEMPIITAGLAPTGNSGGSINDRTYLQQMYSAGLATRGYTNLAIGAHPYGWGNPPDARCCNAVAGRGWDDNSQFFFIETLEAYYDIMARNGHGDLQMWVTEFGWPTWAGFPVEPPEEWMTYISPNQQAEYTIRAFEIGQSLDYVGPMFLWNLNFANETLIEQRNEMAGFSLLVPGLPPRPLVDRLSAQTQ